MTPPIADNELDVYCANGVGVGRAPADIVDMRKESKEEEVDEEVEHQPSKMKPQGTTTTSMPYRSFVAASETNRATSIAVTPSERNTILNKASEVFPGLMTANVLSQKLDLVLKDKANFTRESTLLATSLCCDEVNREFEDSLRDIYGCNFSMGGLAGFAFGGITSFGAMAHHIPTNGSCLIVYGPHVGIDKDGVVGKLNRLGRPGPSGACCGSATAAYGYCQMVLNGECKERKVNPDDFVDAQQVMVGNALLLRHGQRLKDAPVPEVELPYALFDCQDDLMQRIVAKGCGEVATDTATPEGTGGKIALLGGIQINTPNGMSEYFLPQKFVLLNNKGELVADLLEDLNEA